MSSKMPRTPLSTPLSGSAKETEIRIRNIMSGPKKRPPVLFLALMFSVCIFCGNLVSCQVAEAEPPTPDASVDLSQMPDISPIYTPGENCDVLIEGLEGAYVEWNRDNSPSGGFLYFAHDPGFCCPSLAGRTAEGSTLWKDRENRVISVTISINDDRLEDGTIDGYYLHFVVDLGKETVAESAFEAELDEALELSEEEMLYAGQLLARLMEGAEQHASAFMAFDTNEDGILQIEEFPIPTLDMFLGSVTLREPPVDTDISYQNVYRAMAQKVVEDVIELEPNDPMLMLPAMDVLGWYEDENGNDNYVVILRRYFYYDIGIDPEKLPNLDTAKVKIGATDNLALITMGRDGELIELKETLDAADNTERIRDFCGPLDDLAQKLIEEESFPIAEQPYFLIMPQDKELLSYYINYFQTRFVEHYKESKQDE